MRELAEAGLRLTDGACNWSIVAFPSEGWAQLVFGEPDVERLWEAIATAVRLDEPDPVAAWQEHLDAARPARGGAERAAASTPSATGAPAPTSRSGSTPTRSGSRRSTLARDRARREHADRGGLHDARCPPGRRHGRGDLSAPAPGHVVTRPPDPVRGRPGGRGRRRRGPATSCARTSRATRAPPGSARWRSSTSARASARPGSSSTTRSSTRTPRATSRSATRSSRPSPGAEEIAAEERHARGINHSSLHTDFMIGSHEVDDRRCHHGGRRGADPRPTATGCSDSPLHCDERDVAQPG